MNSKTVQKGGMMEKFTLTSKEAAAYIGIGENKIRELIKAGEIAATTNGHGYIIPRPLLEEWILGKAKKGAKI